MAIALQRMAVVFHGWLLPSEDVCGFCVHGCCLPIKGLVYTGITLLPAHQKLVHTGITLLHAVLLHAKLTVVN